MQQVTPVRQPAIISKITKRNSVNRVKLLGIDLLSSKGRHERQVSPNRYPTAVHINQEMALGTWKVRTLN